MKRFFRILLVVVGVLVALIVVAMIALPLFFDPNDYKAQINAAIEQQIGREVNIDGDIGLSVFPWIGLELGHVEVANAKGFGDKPMAQMSAADVSVRLLPLLSRDIEIGSVSLDGLNLRLARNKQGRTNWADITEHLAINQDGETAPEQRSKKPEKSPKRANESGFKLSSLQIGAIEIRDAAVSWQDATTGADYRASGVKLITGRLTDGKPVRMEFGGDFSAPGQNLSGKVHLVARVQPDFTESFYRFSDLTLNVLASGDAVPAGRQQASLTGQGELDMNAGRFKLSGISLQAAGLNVAGAVDGSGLNDKPSYNGRITVENFDPKTVMRELAMQVPATQNSDVLSAAGFDAQFTASDDGVQFKQVLATLDDSSLKGSARVEHFDKPAIGFNLNLDKLNVDDYLPPGSAEQAKTGKPAPTGGDQKEAEIDLSALKNLRLDGELAVGSLTAANIHVTNADLAVKARNGVLTIEPLTADLYEGHLRLTARVDASKDTPRYAIKGNLNGLQFAPLLKDVAGTDRVSAVANMNVDIATAGKQVASMKRTLSGNLGFDLRDGAFSGFNLARIIEAARSQLGGSGEAGKASGSGVGSDTKTPFNRFAANFAIDSGVLAGRDLKLDTKLIDADGAGSYDLAKNALDYTVNATVSKDASGTLEKLGGVTVPIKLTGNLLSPDYKLDVAGALKGVADQRLQEEKSRLKDKVREKLQAHGKDVHGELGNRLQHGLQGVFGGKKGKSGSDDASKD